MSHYDPIVQAPAPTEPTPDPMPIRVADVGAPGRYVLLDDVIQQLRAWSEQTDSISGRDLLSDCADLFGLARAPEQPQDVQEASALVPGPPEQPGAGDGLSAATGGNVQHVETGAYVETPAYSPVVAPVSPPVARIEVFPNEDGSYWYARPVDQTGYIIGVPIEGIRREGVIDDAARAWPGVAIFEIPDGLSDTIWSESNPAATWNGRQRPSTRRLFGK